MSDEKRYRIYLCGGAHCSANGRDRILKTLEEELWAWHLEDDIEIRVSACQDRCDYGPNITIWPGPFRYSRLTPEAMAQIVEQHLLKGQPIAELLAGDQTRR